MNKVFPLTPALAGLLLLSACVPPGIVPNKFDKMEARVEGREVFFTLPEKELADDAKRFMLYTIGVMLENCARDCVRWQLVRALGSNIEPTEENFVNFPIKYGVTLPNMETRAHTPLGPGEYTVTASFTIYKHGEYFDNTKVIGGFTVE